MKNEVLKVIKDPMVAIQGTRKNSAYTQKGKVVESIGAMGEVVKDNMSALWHKRLGHISENSLVELNKKQVFGKLNLEKLDFLKHYVYGIHIELNLIEQDTTIKSLWVMPIQTYDDQQGFKLLVEQGTFYP